jgi:AMP-binding enzyme C-terminal domain/Nuclease-related domain
MRVTLFPCGPAANESELIAFEHLRSRLQAEAGDDPWILLTTLAFSVTHQLQSDEIDLVAVGPGGVRVVEIKHWNPQWLDAHPEDLAGEADRVTNKARKVGTTLRRSTPNLPRVDGALLLTQEVSKVKRFAGHEVRGVRLYTLSDWQNAIGMGAPRLFSLDQVARLARALQPRSAVGRDMAIVGGYNVYPDEIDRVLYAHPKVLEAATIGIPDPLKGERIKAFVVLRPGAEATAEELIAHCRRELAAYKVPREIEFLAELPKSPMMKVLRRELRSREMAGTAQPAVS